MTQCVKSETITVSNAASGVQLTSLAIAKTNGANTVVIQTDAAIRYWTSGTAPTSAQGFQTTAGQSVTFGLNEASNLKMIRAGGSDVAVQVQYLKV